GRAILQPGNMVHTRWRARLAEHLGSFTLEQARGTAARLFTDPLRLAALASACALADAALPEREPHPAVYDGLASLISILEDETGKTWPQAYVRWEVRLLADLGFGLDLARCAATGADNGLAFVSPRTGRAVSADAAGPWRERLLPLPTFLGNRTTDSPAEGADLVAQGLALTGHFLVRHVFEPHGKPMPAARRRLDERIATTARLIRN
ncbi:MAG: DNA repair protein RecO, partial [Alphaproteobacteria bacterium]|nr:DNA repair protein RecO [Alphaproteobacteria bacterium]